MAYCMFTFVMTAADKDTGKTSIMVMYHFIEIIFIVCFVLELLFNKYAFRDLYFQNKFNLVNVVLVGAIIVFWLGDIFIDEYSISIILRVRGCLRLFHIPIILSNIQTRTNTKEDFSMIDFDFSDSDKPNSEKIIDILMQIGDTLEDPKSYNDIHYCIKHIASGTLDKIGVKDSQSQEVGSLRKRRGAILQMEEQAWIKSCTNLVKIKRGSENAGGIVLKTLENQKSLKSCLNLDFDHTKLMEDLDIVKNGTKYIF